MNLCMNAHFYVRPLSGTGLISDVLSQIWQCLGFIMDYHAAVTIASRHIFINAIVSLYYLNIVEYYPSSKRTCSEPRRNATITPIPATRLPASMAYRKAAIKMGSSSG